MIIYIEGVDGSGKTTLRDAIIKKLEQSKDIKVIANEDLRYGTLPTSPTRLNDTQLMEKLQTMTIDNSTVYVCDRGPLSDIIYRVFDDYKPVISLEELWMFWLTNQFMFIIIGCDSDKAEELMKHRGDDNYIAYKYHKEIRYLYQQLLPLFNAVKYDVTKEGQDTQKFVDSLLTTIWSGLNYWRQLKEIMEDNKWNTNIS